MDRALCRVVVGPNDRSTHHGKRKGNNDLQISCLHKEQKLLLILSNIVDVDDQWNEMMTLICSTYWDSKRDIMSTGLGIDVKIQHDSMRDTRITRT